MQDESEKPVKPSEVGQTMYSTIRIEDDNFIVDEKHYFHIEDDTVWADLNEVSKCRIEDISQDLTFMINSGNSFGPLGDYNEAEVSASSTPEEVWVIFNFSIPRRGWQAILGAEAWHRLLYAAIKADKNYSKNLFFEREATDKSDFSEVRILLRLKEITVGEAIKKAITDLREVKSRIDAVGKILFTEIQKLESQASGVRKFLALPR